MNEMTFSEILIGVGAVAATVCCCCIIAWAFVRLFHISELITDSKTDTGATEMRATFYLLGVLAITVVALVVAVSVWVYAAQHWWG